MIFGLFSFIRQIKEKADKAPKEELEEKILLL